MIPNKVTTAILDRPVDYNPVMGLPLSLVNAVVDGFGNPLEMLGSVQMTDKNGKTLITGGNPLASLSIKNPSGYYPFTFVVVPKSFMSDAPDTEVQPVVPNQIIVRLGYVAPLIKKNGLPLTSNSFFGPTSYPI